MKILFVSYHFWPPEFGGELLLSIERFESLTKRGHQVIVLTSGSPGYQDHELTNGIEILRSPMIHLSKIGRVFRRLFFPVWVLAKINRIEFDILHLLGTGGLGPITSNFGNWLACKAAKRKNAKLVYVHSLADTEKEMYSENGVNLKLRKIVLDEMDAIVSVSPAMYEEVKKFFPFTSRFIPNGIHNDIFIPLSTIEKKKKQRQI